MSLSEVAEAAGYRGPSSVQQYFDPEYDIRPLRPSVAMKLGEALMGRGDPPVDMAEVLALSIMPESISRGREVEVAPRTPTLRGRPEDVPVYASALAADLEFDSESGEGAPIETTIFAMNEVISHVRRPPGVDVARRVYAVIISGSSMEPRYRPGDPVFVDPRRPPSIGDDVVIQLRAPDDSGEIVTGLIKTLVKRSASFVELEQYQPSVRFRLPMARVAEIHRVIPWREAFGI